EVVGADHDRQRGQAADAALQLLQRHGGRRALRQQLPQVRAEVAVEPDREGQGGREQGESGRQEQPGPRDGQGGEALPQAVPSPPVWTGLHAAQDGTCYPAPCRAATLAMASRNRASPARLTSFSMVSAGCRSMACVSLIASS